MLEECTVRTLLMHRPWEHAEQIQGMFKDGRITVKGLEFRMEKALQAACDLEALAMYKGIPIHEPFTGDRTQDGTLQVLGPSRLYYEGLLADFRCTPDARCTMRRSRGQSPSLISVRFRSAAGRAHLLTEDPACVPAPAVRQGRTRPSSLLRRRLFPPYNPSPVIDPRGS